MDKILPYIIVLVIVVLIYLVVFLLCYRKCPRDKILVVYGYLGKNKKGELRTAKGIHGGGAFIWPIIQSYEFLDLKPVSMNINLNSGVPINAELSVGISTENLILQNAIERLLGLSQTEIGEFAKDILIGTIEDTIVQIGSEQVKIMKNEFIEIVFKTADVELNKIGLKLVRGRMDILNEREMIFIIYVKDQDKSKELYKSLLVMDPTLDVPGMTEFTLANNVKLGIMPEDGIVRILEGKIPHPNKANGISRNEIYLYVDNPEEYLNKLILLGGKEISKSEVRNWGDLVSYGYDLDGHIVAFAKRLN